MESLAEHLKYIIERGSYLLEGGRYSLNVASLPLKKARAYAEEQFQAAGENLDDVLPAFDQNYALIQKKCKKALNISRIDMPVIEPEDMAVFDNALKKGQIDIFKPYAKGKLYTPKNMSKGEGEQWVKLGYSDGDYSDDLLKGKWTRIAVKNLLPTQSQIWLEKLIGNILKFGKPGPGSPVLNTTIIVSKEGYILDGHHRFGQAMLADPNLKIRALFLPLDIKTLLKIGKSYGAAIGRKGKA